MARRPIRSGKTIDYKQWSLLPAARVSTASVSTQISSALSFVIPATILRVRATLVILLDGAAEGGVQGVVSALGIVSTDAFAAGAGSMPDPAAEPEYPWLWWKSAELISQTTGATAGQSDIGSAVRYDVDTKAMRKVKPGQSLVWVYSITDALAVDILQGHGRVLIGT